MPHPEQRPSYLQSVIATFLERNVEFPGGVLATVTRVETSPSRREATAWISVLPSEHAEEVMMILATHLYDLQGAVNQALQTRPTPRLKLRHDPGPEQAARLEKLAQTS